MDHKNERINRLVIVVHGNSRNPFTYHKNMRAAAEKAGTSENTLVIAPGFIMEKDLNENKGRSFCGRLCSSAKKRCSWCHF
ncbi:MAG TPA: hypothetical protein VNA26_07095 [Chitinophagaceae bacterium]|nr:hypothetical protein [Chitinophagaceae bacterium]